MPKRCGPSRAKPSRAGQGRAGLNRGELIQSHACIKSKTECAMREVPMPGCPHGGSIRGRCFQHPGIPCAMPEVPMHNLIKFESPCAMPDGQPKGGKIPAQCQPFSQQKKRAAGRKPRRASGVAIWMAQNVLMSKFHARCESSSCAIFSMTKNPCAMPDILQSC